MASYIVIKHYHLITLISDKFNSSHLPIIQWKDSLQYKMCKETFIHWLISSERKMKTKEHQKPVLVWTWLILGSEWSTVVLVVTFIKQEDKLHEQSTMIPKSMKVSHCTTSNNINRLLIFLFILIGTNINLVYKLLLLSKHISVKWSLDFCSLMKIIFSPGLHPFALE